MVETTGGEVARREVTGSEAEARRLVEHLRRLIALSDPHLVPVRSAAHKGTTVTIVFEPGPGRPLRELLDEGGRPTPLQATAVGLEVLAGLVALQHAGLGHGALDEANVHVAPHGQVRLMGYGMQPRFRVGADRPAWPDPRNDLIAAGRLLCEMLGVSLAPAPREPLRDAERVLPAVVAAARALAAGHSRNASAAIVSLRSAAGSLAEPAQLQRQLALLAPLAFHRQPAGARLVSTLSAAAEAQPVRARRPAPGPRRRARGLGAAGILALLLGVGLLVASLVQAAAPRGLARAPQPLAIAPAAPAESPPAGAAPADAAPDAEPAADQPSAPAAPEEASPTGAVSDFYQLVQQHHFAAAIQLWTARMQVAYPPDQNVTQRFADTTSLRLIRAQVSSEGSGQAVVSIELEEVRDGRTYRWVGSWSLVRESSGWRLDQPALSLKQ